MSNISLVEATLPPGFRFHPRDEELICDYLFKKVSHSDLVDLLVEIDLNKCEPWDLPETARVGDKEWYFYSQRDRKYATGLRTNRATITGYWKATGKDRSILRNRILVGMRKTLVFYIGRAPKGKKSDWVMHEFRLESPQTPPLDSSYKGEWVLCRVFCKNKEKVDGKEKLNTKNINNYAINKHVESCSSSLPPLIEPYTLSFQKTQPNNSTNYTLNRQVPCFSKVLNQNTPHFDLTNNNHDMFSTIVPPLLPHDLTIPTSSSSNCGDKNDVIKAVLSRFNNKQIKFNESTLNFDEDACNYSLFSDETFPITMWYP